MVHSGRLVLIEMVLTSAGALQSWGPGSKKKNDSNEKAKLSITS